jgi:hypothetical protein
MNDTLVMQAAAPCSEVQVPTSELTPSVMRELGMIAAQLPSLASIAQSLAFDWPDLEDLLGGGVWGPGKKGH